MSIPLPSNDPARWMLYDDFTTTPRVYLEGCYICEDPEFAQMGLPLCYPCHWCGTNGHVAADDTVCDACGKEQPCGPEDEPDKLTPGEEEDSRPELAGDSDGNGKTTVPGADL